MKSSTRLSSAEWEALLARIQSPSKELEAHLARANANLIDALSGLEGLEKLTELHLAPPAPALPPAPPAQSVQYQTSHEEYAPALNQSALVEALLQYQRKKAMRSPKPAAQARSQNASPGAGRGSDRGPDQIHSTPAFSRSDFSPMRIPEIEAEPKAAPLGRTASPSVRLPVLRLKSENAASPSSGNPHDDEQS